MQYPSLASSRVRHIELVPLSDTRLMKVFITDSGRVEQRLLDIQSPIDETFLGELRARLNAALVGVGLTDAAASLTIHYNWHWFWHWGNGELGNWGPHILDDLRNVVFRDKIALPKRVLAGGGRFGWNDAGETPNTHFVYFDTGDVPVVMDVHNLPRKTGMKAPDVYLRRRTSAFLVIECEGGYYAGGRGGGSAHDLNGKVIQKFKGDGGATHAANFIAAIRSRKSEELKGEIEKIH